MTILGLYSQIAAVCPILEVSAGDMNDKTTWVVRYAPEANLLQRSAVVTVVLLAPPLSPP